MVLPSNFNFKTFVSHYMESRQGRRLSSECQSNLKTSVGVNRLRKITYMVKSLIRGSHFNMTGDEVAMSLQRGL